MLKRIFDVLLSLAGFIIFLPLWIIIPIAIFMEDGPPIFFSDTRIGRDKAQYKHLKFRSMKKGPEITKVGAILRVTAMDELPQIVNIFKGEMSFVGPRPLKPIELDVQTNELKAVWDYDGFQERAAIRPGLTGVTQVLTPKDAPRSIKFKYDIWYVQNRNFMLDIWLLLLSFIVTFLGRWERRKDKLEILTKPLRMRVEKGFH